MTNKKIEITEVVLRDAHQSFIATRMSTADTLPIVGKMNQADYYALECWGGATYAAEIIRVMESIWNRESVIQGSGYDFDCPSLSLSGN